jgi:hypothetical protein
LGHKEKIFNRQRRLITKLKVMKPVESGILKSLLITSVFALSMGFLESAVVVYLREIYYPAGFNFPMVPLAHHILITEIYRELATLLMLLGIGYLAGKNFSTRFAWFIYAFAIWDIFYYVFLKLLLNWPESLLTYDLLFLIPVTWVGPVIAPIIVSLSMIVFALVIIFRTHKGIPSHIGSRVWLSLVSGSLVIILAFTWDYSAYILENHNFTGIFSSPNQQSIPEAAFNYIPLKFNWFLFCFGQLVILYGIFIYWFKKSE